MVDFGVDLVIGTGGAALPEPVVGVRERIAGRRGGREVLVESLRDRILSRRRYDVAGERIAQRRSARVHISAVRIEKGNQVAVAQAGVGEVAR